MTLSDCRKLVEHVTERATHGGEITAPGEVNVYLAGGATPAQQEKIQRMAALGVIIRVVKQDPPF